MSSNAAYIGSSTCIQV